jgi:hypothetical protein
MTGTRTPKEKLIAEMTTEEILDRLGVLLGRLRGIQRGPDTPPT